jgi:hypothetical protein
MVAGMTEECHHAQLLDALFFTWESTCVVQAGLELLGSSNLPASASVAGTTGAYHGAWLNALSLFNFVVVVAGVQIKALHILTTCFTTELYLSFKCSFLSTATLDYKIPPVTNRKKSPTILSGKSVTAL